MRSRSRTTSEHRDTGLLADGRHRDTGPIADGRHHDTVGPEREHPEARTPGTSPAPTASAASAASTAFTATRASADSATPATRTGGAIGTTRRRRAGRSRPVLMCAIASIPVALVTGCSALGSSSGSSGAASGTATPSPSASVRYATLPNPCGAISAKTVTSLVPGAKKRKGTEADSGQPDQRGGCSWNGLHGYQYRYLDTAFQRFDNVAGAAPADAQAEAAYTGAVRTTDTEASAVKARPATHALHRTGDKATLISWDSTKDHTVYRSVTVIARSANAVVTVYYTGAGLQGDHKPTMTGLRAGAEKAAGQALAALG